MHFVSMISIRLKAAPAPYGNPNGAVQWYMQFSAGMTVMSLFIPLVATSFAFWFLASEAEFVWWRGLISGVIVGLTSEYTQPLQPGSGSDPGQALARTQG